MNPTDNPAPRGVLLMLLSVLLFATNTLLLRYVTMHLPQADGWLALLCRGAVGMAMVGALYGFGRGLSLKALIGNKLVSLRGIIGALSTAAFYLTITHLGPARAVVLSLTYPVFATLIAAIWLKERISVLAMIWMIAGFAGLVVFLGGDLQHGITRWDLIGLAGAVGAGIVVVIIRKLRDVEHAGTIYGSLCFYCILFALPMTGMTVTKLPPAGIGLLIAAALVVGISQLLMTNAYRFLPVSRGSSIQMLLPVVTAAGAYLVFGDLFSHAEMAGAALTLLATWRVAAA